MSKKDKQVKGQEVVAPQQETTQVTETQQVAAPAAPAAPAPKDPTLVLGAKAPKHRVGHNSAAWAVITPMLPCAASKLAEAVGKVPNIGGPKGNGMLYVSYAIRRGWLAEQAQ